MLELPSMNYTFAEESFDSLTAYWNGPESHLARGPVFVHPAWLRTWWQAFGSVSRLYLRSVREGNEVIGIAPLRVRNKIACFIGSADVCDYLDFPVVPGREKGFFNSLLDDLAKAGIKRIDLRPLRQDSATVTSLVPLAQERGIDALCRPAGVSVEMDLPLSWDDYLENLSAKDRHELERKLRRLYESGRVNYRSVEDDSPMDIFLELFTASRTDKAAFMTARMESFFRSMASAMAQAGLLRFGILELDEVAIAIVLTFEYNNRVYLYNSGYDTEYRSLSAGLLSKAFCVKDSIERGKRKFDFLKGGEAYKYHLGGKEIHLSDCRIKLG